MSKGAGENDHGLMGTREAISYTQQNFLADVRGEQLDC